MCWHIPAILAQIVYTEFQASLGYIRLSQNKQATNKNLNMYTVFTYLNITHLSSMYACMCTHTRSLINVSSFQVPCQAYDFGFIFHFFFSKTFIYLFYVFMLCLYVCLCTMCKADANRGQKMALDTLKLKLLIFVRYSVRARN